MRRIRYLFQIALRMIRELSTVDLVQTKQVNLSPDETRRLVSDGNSATYTALARQGTCCVNCAILLGTGAILECCYFFYFVLTRGKGQLVTLILFCFSKSSFHFLTTRMTSGGVSKHPTVLCHLWWLLLLHTFFNSLLHRLFISSGNASSSLLCVMIRIVERRWLSWKQPLISNRQESRPESQPQSNIWLS